MGADDPPGNRKAKAAAIHGAIVRGVSAKERIKKLRNQLWRDARSGIADS